MFRVSRRYFLISETLHHLTTMRRMMTVMTIILIQKITHYGPHIYSIAVCHVFRLFQILTNIRRAHDIVILMCVFIIRNMYVYPYMCIKQQWLSHIQNFCFTYRHGPIFTTLPISIENGFTCITCLDCMCCFVVCTMCSFRSSVFARTKHAPPGGGGGGATKKKEGGGGGGGQKDCLSMMIV